MAVSRGCTPLLAYTECIYRPIRCERELIAYVRVALDSPDYGYVPMNEHLPQYVKTGEL